MAFPVGDGIDPDSFHLGMCCAFIEVVGLGAKRLALSPPMTDEEIAAVREQIDAFAAEFGVLTTIEADPLVTKLFNPGFTRGKSVILFALDKSVFAEYEALKHARRDIPPETEHQADHDIARLFGRLLSYSEPAIDDLLRNPRF